jgi:glycosyltransferase involved in cell wall biosynthesis
MPVFNSRRFLGASIQSVLDQTWPECELIIVDDGSSDGSYEEALTYAKADDRVRVYTHPGHKNRGVSASRNLACRHARGECLAFIDSDDTWVPEKLAKQMSVLDESGKAGFCYALGTIERSGTGMNYLTDTEVRGDPPVEDPSAAVMAVASARMQFCFSTLVVRRTLFERTGGFVERLPFQDEDRILLGQLCLLGGSAWVPEPLCVYRVHDTSATADVMRKKFEHVVNFDVASRLMIWVARQPGGRDLGRAILQGPYERFLRSWFEEGISVGQWPLLVGHMGLTLWTFPHAGPDLARRVLRRVTGM